VRKFSLILLVLVVVLTAIPATAPACPTCFSAPDSPTGDGVRLAVLSLLAVTGTVLAGFATLFLYIRKRSKLFGISSSQGDR
jgi:protein-S-isoprenylcysteine O-methyltransferase Ste14